MVKQVIFSTNMQCKLFDESNNSLYILLKRIKLYIFELILQSGTSVYGIYLWVIESKYTRSGLNKIKQ